MSRVPSSFVSFSKSYCAELTPSEASLFLEQNQPSKQVRAHCEMVGLVARALATALVDAGIPCDVEAVHAAGIVHDVCKGKPHHDSEAVRLFLSMGMPRMAVLTGHHQDMHVEPEGAFTEAEVIFLADKLVQGVQVVPVYARYDAKMSRYSDDPEALAAVQMRRSNAINTLSRFARLTGCDAEQIAHRVVECVSSTDSLSKGRHEQDGLNDVLNTEVAVVILAAGFSSRMGKFKPLLPFGNGTVLSHVVSTWRQCDIKNILAVSGHMGASLEIEAARIGIRAVRNQHPEKGMFSSVQLGLKALLKYTHSSWIAIQPVDIPLLNPKTIQALSEEIKHTKADVVYPVCNGKQGHPPFIRRSVAEYAVQINIESNLRDTLARFSSSCVDIDDTGILTDMDFPYEYDYALQRLRAMQN